MPSSAVYLSNLDFLYLDYPVGRQYMPCKQHLRGRYVEAISLITTSLPFERILISASKPRAPPNTDCGDSMVCHDMLFNCRRSLREYQGVLGGHSPPAPLGLCVLLHHFPCQNGKARKARSRGEAGGGRCNRRMHRPIPITIRLDMV